MARRIYLVPKIGAGIGGDPYRPKYFIGADGGSLTGAAVHCMDYGLEPVFLVAAEMTAAAHLIIAANADVVSFPANLDAAIGANIAVVRTALDALNVPSDWLTTTTTYRTVVQWITRLCLFAQRLHGTGAARMVPAGKTLNTTWGNLDAEHQSKLRTAAETFAVDLSAVTLSMTVRDVLKVFANGTPSAPSLLGQAL